MQLLWNKSNKSLLILVVKTLKSAHLENHTLEDHEQWHNIPEEEEDKLSWIDARLLMQKMKNTGARILSDCVSEINIRIVVGAEKFCNFEQRGE